LADEPVGNLDSESAKTVMNTLKEINVNDQKTVILVTHDPRYLAYADRVYFFEDAHIIREEKGGSASPDEHEVKALSLSLDLEKMAHLHHALSMPELKAWSVSSWLIDELVPEQEARLEKAMSLLLAGQLSPHGFYEELDLSFQKGGVGLYRHTAIIFAKRVAHLLHEMRLFDERFKKADTPTKKEHVARMLRSFLLEEHKGDLTPEEQEAMSRAIEARINDKMTHEAFVNILAGKKLLGGVGLTKIASERMAERLELVVSNIK
jgi:putative ABC transport system ATP-binding protein